MPHSALHNLPDAVADWLGDLSLPEEPRADCAACPMACAEEKLADNPRLFHEDVRCCTYHPALPNWLVGQILEAGGPGASLIRARMADRDGVSASGIRASRSYTSACRSLGEPGFGRSVAVRCPYWVGGELACGIWSHRDAACRSWFCKTQDGPRSVALWMRLKTLLRAMEDHLRNLCMARGTPPPDDADDETLCGWYRQCAAVVAQLTTEDLEHPELIEVRGSLAELQAVIGQPLPPLLGASVSDMQPAEGGIKMRGYSRWDPVVAPMGIFRLLGRLDGALGWREALAMANSELDEPIPEALVEEMYRRGALQPLSGPEDLAVGGAVRLSRGEEAQSSWTDAL